MFSVDDKNGKFTALHHKRTGTKPADGGGYMRRATAEKLVSDLQPLLEPF